MRKRSKEAILISFFREKEKYEKLADYIIHLIGDDPSSPKENIHTITYRIKDNSRLIEKIDDENKQLEAESQPITHKNFQKRVEDILGIRLICLRLSDIKRVEAYLGFLDDEKIIRFKRQPDHKRSFILPVDPGESIPEGLDLRYSGYSSIHYQVELGENSDAASELKGLQVEFQLRTILEEAWGEIDHKYRYVHNRIGDTLPDYIHTGFYNLSAYLQAAALQAEHLCRQVETYSQSKNEKLKRKLVSPVDAASSMTMIDMDANKQESSPIIFKKLLKETFGFQLTGRTFAYIQKRLDGFGYGEEPQVVFRKTLTKNRLQEFKTLFREILHCEAFTEKNKRNVDAINALNFALSDEKHGGRVAHEGLRSILKWRKKRFGC